MAWFVGAGLISAQLDNHSWGQPVSVAWPPRSSLILLLLLPWYQSSSPCSQPPGHISTPWQLQSVLSKLSHPLFFTWLFAPRPGWHTLLYVSSAALKIDAIWHLSINSLTSPIISVVANISPTHRKYVHNATLDDQLDNRASVVVFWKDN